MSSERRWPRRTLRVVGALAAAAVGTYGAERLAVSRWSAADDPFRNEPQKLTGAERWVDVADGSRLRAVLDGDGPTVILAHGFTSVADHWAPLAERLLAQGLRVVAFDQRGHGASTAGNGRFRPSDLANDLAAVIQATAPLSGGTNGANPAASVHDGPVVVGHSMGGIGIGAFLAEYPKLAERLSGIVLISTLARPVDVPLAKLMSGLAGTALARRTMAHPIHGRIMTRGGLGAMPAVTVLDVVRSGWAECPDETRAGVMTDLPAFDFTEALRAVNVPTTVVCGDRDNVTPLEENRRIASLVPNARLEVMADVGHIAPWEGVDRIAEIIANHARQPVLGERS